MNILIMGVAGSGKGTMSAYIKEHFEIPHISTGDMFRQAIRNQTPLGILAKKYIDHGLLVPDDVTIKMVEERLKQSDTANGFLLDGFPRTLIQTGALTKLLRNLEKDLDVVINLQVDFDVLEKRITGRRVCKKCGSIYNIYNKQPKLEGICDNCGNPLTQRSDDTKQQLEIRLEEYEHLTRPVIDFYSGSGEMVNIDANVDVAEVWESLKTKLEQFIND